MAFLDRLVHSRVCWLDGAIQKSLVFLSDSE